MALVVNVDGHARQITGHVEESTVTDVITALAHANNKIGRFSLVLQNKTNNMDYFLRSNDIPYKVLQKFKSRGIDVCLELRDANEIAGIFSTQDLIKRTSPETLSTDVVDFTASKKACSRQNSLEFDDLLSGMSNAELKELIQNQEKTLWQHQIKIVGLENELIEDNDRELLQLLRQRHNLRRTLKELNQVDWKHYKAVDMAELKNSISIIESLKQQISMKQYQLEECLCKNEKLINEIRDSG